jgi:hypothetical protein
MAKLKYRRVSTLEPGFFHFEGNGSCPKQAAHAVAYS